MLAQAGARLAAGQPPTDNAEAEWAAAARQEATLADLRQQREEVSPVCAWLCWIAGSWLGLTIEQRHHAQPY